jgi:hypothetical protein
MKRVLILGVAALIALVAVDASAQSRQAGPPVAGQAQTTVGPNFIDNDGDGICDRFQTGTRPGSGQGIANGRGNGYGRGKGDGTRIGPQDGTGFGPGPAAGGGTCDGTGPKGKGRGPRR